MNELHDKYLNEGEDVYAAKVDSVTSYSGKNRVLLDISIASQRIESVRIYWDNYSDSLDVSIGNQIGVFSQLFNGLEENSYVFNLVSFDKFGNKSLPFEATGIVYGDQFQSRLSNRAIKSAYADAEGLTINWSGIVDYGIYSKVSYKDTDGKDKIIQVPLSENTTVIPDWSSELSYQTLFMPEETAIDTFYSEWKTITGIPVKYSTQGWTATCRDGNHGWGEYGGEPEKVLDGNINTGWHTRVGSSLPQCLVVDMQESLPVHHITLWHLPAGLSSNWIYYKTIQVYLSDTPVTPDVYQESWGEPVATYVYPGGFDGVTINFNPNSKGRYMVVLFLDSSSSTYISFAELEVYNQ
jgi:hypothetical protein